MNVEFNYLDKKSVFQSNLCRLCSTLRENVLPIFDNLDNKIYLTLKECLPNIKIRQEDDKPQQICLDCISKVNMYNEFLQLCLQSEYKFDTYLQHFRNEQANNLNGTENQLWLNDGNKINQSNGGPQNDAGVIVLRKLDTTVSDPSTQDLVVMVELKYKDNIQPTNNSYIDSVTEKAPLSLIEDSADILNFDSLLDLDSMKENTNKLYDNTLMDVISKQNKILKDEKEAEICSNERREKINVDKKSYECEVCNRKFNRRTRLNSHMARHTESRPYKCRQCDKSFVMKWELNFHDRVHSRTYACPLCSKVFGSKSKLSRHGRVHSGERPYPCPECGKAFGEKRNLDNHVRTHSGARPYSCQLCGKSFSVRSHMVDHLNVHKRTPRFQCPSCKKSFKWKTNYNRHIRIHKHSESSPVSF